MRLAACLTNHVKNIYAEQYGHDPRSGRFNTREILRALWEAGLVDSKPGLSKAWGGDAGLGGGGGRKKRSLSTNSY